MTKKDFIIIADTIFTFIENPTIKDKLTVGDKVFLINLFSVQLKNQNYRFDRQKFEKKALGLESLVEAIK